MTVTPGSRVKWLSPRQLHLQEVEEGGAPSKTVAGVPHLLSEPLCVGKKGLPSASFSETRVAFEFMSCSIRSPNSQRKADTEPVDDSEEGFELRVCLALKKVLPRALARDGIGLSDGLPKS